MKDCRIQATPPYLLRIPASITVSSVSSTASHIGSLLLVKKVLHSTKTYTSFAKLFTTCRRFQRTLTLRMPSFIFPNVPSVRVSVLYSFSNNFVSIGSRHCLYAFPNQPPMFPWRQSFFRFTCYALFRPGQAPFRSVLVPLQGLRCQVHYYWPASELARSFHYNVTVCPSCI